MSSSSSATVDSACGDSNSATMCNESADAPNAEGSSNDGDERAAVDRKSDSNSDDNYCEEDVDNEQEGDGEEEEQDEEDDEEEDDDEEEASSSVSTERKPRAATVRRSCATSRLRAGRPSSANESDSGSDDDSSDMADDTPRKTIQVGADFQAKIPPLDRAPYPDEKPLDSEDKLLWDPNMLLDSTAFEYLSKIRELRHRASKEKVAALLKEGLSTSVWETIVAATIESLPHGSHVADDEHALYTLMQCSFNVNEALKKMVPGQQLAVTDRNTQNQWSEEECQNFETGLRIYGKRFTDIQQNKVRNRSVGDLVQFYYIWKKTERHDMFGNKARLEKKKYALHPGTTDYIDRYLDEPDAQAPLDAVHASLVLPYSAATLPPNLVAAAAAVLSPAATSAAVSATSAGAAATSAGAAATSASGTAPSAAGAATSAAGKLLSASHIVSGGSISSSGVSGGGSSSSGTGSPVSSAVTASSVSAASGGSGGAGAVAAL